MPITFVEEHVVDRIRREKKSWGKAAVVSPGWACALVGRGLPAVGASGSSSAPPEARPDRTPDCWV